MGLFAKNNIDLGLLWHPLPFWGELIAVFDLKPGQALGSLKAGGEGVAGKGVGKLLVGAVKRFPIEGLDVRGKAAADIAGEVGIARIIGHGRRSYGGRHRFN